MRLSVLFGVFFIVALFSCKQPVGDSGTNDDTSGNSVQENVTVNFFNESSFKVYIYKNINPSSSDTSTKPIATVSPGATLKVMQTPSEDQIVGDVFYVRYNVQFADAFSSGTGSAIYVQAERDISNIAFVLEPNKTYTKTIGQPASGQLQFVNGYIKVQNTGSSTFQVFNGNTIIKNLATQEVNLSSGKFAFFALGIVAGQSSSQMANLNFFVTTDGSKKVVPVFNMERGKLYAFEFNGTSITGPTVTNITY